MKEITQGQIIPYGLSFCINRSNFTNKTYFLRIPIFFSNSYKYDISCDEMRKKKWIFNIMFCIDFYHNGIGIRFMQAWT